MQAQTIVIFLVGFAAGFFVRTFFWLSLVVVILGAAAWIYLNANQSGQSPGLLGGVFGRIVQSIQRRR